MSAGTALTVQTAAGDPPTGVRETRERDAVGGVTTGRLARADFALVGLWIASFTVGRDVLGQLKLYDVLSAIVIVRFFGLTFLRSRRFDGPLRGAALLLAAFVVGTFVTFLRGPEMLAPEVVILRLYRGAAYVSVFFVLYRLELDAGTLRRLLAIISGAVFVQAVLIAAQSLGIIGSLWPENEMTYGRNVPTGTLGINHLNSVLFMSVGLVSLMALYGLRRRRRLWVAFAFSVVASLMVFAMLRGEARTALIALPSLAMFSLQSRQGRIIAAGVVVFGIASQGRSELSYVDQIREVWESRVVAKTAGSEDLLGHYLDEQSNSRVAIWKNTAEAVLSRPDVLVAGIGYQNFGMLNIGAIAAHNIYLHYLAELGLLGLFALLVFLRQLAGVLQSRRRGRGPVAAVAAPGLSFVLTLIVIGFGNESLYSGRATFGWMGFCMAFLAVLAHPGWRWQESARERALRTRPVRPKPEGPWARATSESTKAGKERAAWAGRAGWGDRRVG